MKLLRSIPILLYLLVMVVLPYAHLASAEHSADHDHDAHQSCALCQLLSQAADISETKPTIRILFISSMVPPAIAQEPDSHPLLARCARAPPFVIV